MPSRRLKLIALRRYLVAWTETGVKLPMLLHNGCPSSCSLYRSADMVLYQSKLTSPFTWTQWTLPRKIFRVFTVLVSWMQATESPGWKWHGSFGCVVVWLWVVTHWLSMWPKIEFWRPDIKNLLPVVNSPFPLCWKLVLGMEKSTFRAVSSFWQHAKKFTCLTSQLGLGGN